MAQTSHYDERKADYAVSFIECLKHTKGSFYNAPFKLLGWQERIIRDLFGIIKPDGYRQFNTAYIECPKKQGKTELAAAVCLLLWELPYLRPLCWLVFAWQVFILFTGPFASGIMNT